MLLHFELGSAGGAVSIPFKPWLQPGCPQLFGSSSSATAAATRQMPSRCVLFLLSYAHTFRCHVLHDYSFQRVLQFLSACQRHLRMDQFAVLSLIVVVAPRSRKLLVVLRRVCWNLEHRDIGAVNRNGDLISCWFRHGLLAALLTWSWLFAPNAREHA